MSDAITNPTETLETERALLKGRRVTASGSWRSNRKAPRVICTIGAPDATATNRRLTVTAIGFHRSRAISAPSLEKCACQLKAPYNA